MTSEASVRGLPSVLPVPVRHFSAAAQLRTRPYVVTTNREHTTYRHLNQK